jgi:hypothetical protein
VVGENLVDPRRRVGQDTRMAAVADGRLPGAEFPEELDVRQEPPVRRPVSPGGKVSTGFGEISPIT